MLFDAGLLPPDVRTTDPKAVGAMCQAALQRWVDERSVGFKALSLTVSFDGLHEWEWNERRAAARVRRCCYANEVAQVSCAATMQRLFCIDPRLPHAVLARAGRASWKAVPLLSCADQIGLAEWLLWGGCQSPEEHADENELEGEDRASYLESTLRRAELIERTPRWLLEQPEGTGPLSDTELRAIAAGTVDPLCSQILVTLAALEALETPTKAMHERLQQDGGQFVGYSALVRYNTDDHLVHLAEELGNYAMESGDAYDSVIFDVLLPGNGEEFAEWLDDLAAWLRACRLLDHLLFLLGGADSIYGGEGK